jgi:hypothetical protein
MFCKSQIGFIPETTLKMTAGMGFKGATRGVAGDEIKSAPRRVYKNYFIYSRL